MKRKPVLIGVCAGLLLALTGCLNPYQADFGDQAYSDTPITDSPTKAMIKGAWQPVGILGQDARYFSLAVDPSGVPFVAYRDAANGGKATVLRYLGGSSWQAVGQMGFSAYSVSWISLAIDRSHTPCIPYVAYADGTYGGRVTVMKNTDGGWQTVGTARFSEQQASHIVLAVDQWGTPYVSYLDSAYQGTSYPPRYVVKYADGSWQTVGTFADGAGTQISLVIDPRGTPYVAYPGFFMVGSGVSLGAKVMRYAGDSWQTVGIAAPAGYAVSLAFDPKGFPYVASSVPGKVTVMKYNKASWQTVGTAEFSGASAFPVSLAIDKRGVPYVAYQDDANGGRATVMTYDGRSWQPVGKAGFSAGEARDVCLAIDPRGIPFVAYHGNINDGSRLTVMRFNVVF